MTAFSLGLGNGKQGAELVLALLDKGTILSFAFRILTARIVLDDRRDGVSGQFRQEPACKEGGLPDR